MVYRYFVFGDVHGDFTALKKELEKEGYNENDSTHILVSLGDNFDRGNENVEVYKFLRRNQALTVRGNHEDFLFEYLAEFDNGVWNCQQNGMWETVRDFSKVPIPASNYEGMLPHLRYLIQDNFMDMTSWLIKMPAGYKIGNYILTHGGFQNPSLIDNYEDKRWFPISDPKTPIFIQNYKEYLDEFIFIFGHWHSFDLRKRFSKNKLEGPMPFMWKNFIGLDGCTTLFHKVNVFVINSNKKAIPFSNRHNLEEIKKL